MFASLCSIEKSEQEAAEEEYKEALFKYNQARQNFKNAEEAYIEKSIYDLKSAEMGLSFVLQRIRSDYL